MGVAGSSPASTMSPTVLPQPSGATAVGALGSSSGASEAPRARERRRAYSAHPAKATAKKGVQEKKRGSLKDESSKSAPAGPSSRCATTCVRRSSAPTTGKATRNATSSCLCGNQIFNPTSMCA